MKTTLESSMAKLYASEVAVRCANEGVQIHVYAVQLLGEKKRDEAFEVFKKNAQAHPDLWFVHSGMARVYSAQGDFDNAVKEMKVAYAKAPDQNKPFIETFIKRLEAKDDITR